MEDIEIRAVRSRDELEETFDLWAEVFPENRSFFQERVDLYTHYDKETTWVARTERKIVSAVHVFPYYISLENIFLKVGGIAYVATLPDYRGKSLAQIILKRLTRWMNFHGYDLSLLFTPINAYYEKLGWTTVPRKSYSLKELYLPSIDEERKYSVTDFEEKDLREVQKIYEQFNQKYIGPRIRMLDYWKGQIRWQKEDPGRFLVARKDGKIVGYIRAKFNADGEITLNECCYLQDEEQSVVALLREVLSKRQEFKNLRASVPNSHMLYQLFQKNRAEEEFITEEMWKVLDLKRLVKKLEPILSKRLNQEYIKERGGSFPSSILLACGASEIFISFHHGIVDIQAPIDSLYYQKLLKLKENEFISLLLKGKERNDDLIISALFPKQPYQLWDLDSF